MTPPPPAPTHFVGNCRACGYPLLRLKNHRCPECGTPFNPEDPRTMDLGRSRLVTFLATPTTLWTWLPTLFTAGAAMAATFVMPLPFLNIPLIAAALLVAVATLYITAARRRFHRFMRNRERDLQRSHPEGSRRPL
jgi:hypothetical protein